MTSEVKNPEHYNKGDIECIVAIEAMLGRDQFLAYCRGNALKYLWRCQYKGSTVTDLEKAEWYIRKTIETMVSSAPNPSER